MTQLSASMFGTDETALPLETVLEELIADGITEEHFSMLFGLLRKNVRSAGVHCARGDFEERTAAAHAAIDVAVFLRRHLKADRNHPFNGALDRFYLAIHRRIADACRDGKADDFFNLEAAIDRLAASVLSKTFLERCFEQSEIAPRAFTAFLTGVLTRDDASRMVEDETATVH